MATASSEATNLEVTLVLSEAEAQFLADVFGQIGGDRFHSRRGLSDSIAAALYGVGYVWHGSSYQGDKQDHEGSITFKRLTADA